MGADRKSGVPFHVRANEDGPTKWLAATQADVLGFGTG